MKTIIAGWALTATIGAMIEAVPSTGFECWAWSAFAIFAATLFVHLIKEQQ